MNDQNNGNIPGQVPPQPAPPQPPAPAQGYYPQPTNQGMPPPAGYGLAYPRVPAQPPQPPPPAYSVPTQPYGYPPMYPLPPKPPKQGLGKSITGMCLGIAGAFMGLIAIMISWVPYAGLVSGLIYGIFALGLGIPGLILSISVRKEGTDNSVRGMALAGLITSVVALSLGGLSLFVAVACTCVYYGMY